MHWRVFQSPEILQLCAVSFELITPVRQIKSDDILCISNVGCGFAKLKEYLQI
jgi:hypothetical protein